jgi:fibronectin-binding autotransporter adhesin
VTFGAPFANPAAAFDVGSSYSFSGATNILEGAIVVFDATASTSTLNQSAGTLGGSATLTVAGLTTWTGGTMSGSGITNSLGGLSLGASGDTGDYETLAGRTLLSAGTGVWYGPDTLVQQDNSTFLNYSGATLSIEAGGNWGLGDETDPSGTFQNSGTLIVADGSASTVVQPFFRNTSTVEVASGTLQLGGGGSCTSSPAPIKAGLQVDSGATLLFGNNYNYETYNFDSGSYASGAGAVTFGAGVSANFASGSTYNPSGETLIDTEGNSGANVVFTAGSNVGALGELTIDSGVVNFSTGVTITIVSLNLAAGGGGSLTGSDTVDVSGLLTWTDGTMDGTGTTVAEGGLDLGMVDTAYHVATLESRTFINQGMANWVGSGEIDLFAGSTFINEPGATFNEQTNDEIWSDVGVGEAPSGLFDNQGTFVLAGGGQATMESSFDNEGRVEISSGLWELSGVGSSLGDFIMDAGATLQLNQYYGIPYTTPGGPFVSSPQIVGGNSSNVTLIDGRQTGPEALGGTMTISGGFFETGDDTISSLDMSDGWLTITGTLTVTGAMTWTGGYIVGPGTLIVEGGLQLGTGMTDQQESLYGATLINQSTITLADQDVFAQEVGATVENEILSTIDIQGGVSWDGDGTENIDNQGTIDVAAGSGTSTINYIALTNDGIVMVSSGTLDLEGGGTATGSFTAQTGTSLEFGHSDWAFDSTSNVSGAGTVEFTFAYWPSIFNSNSVYNVSGDTVFDSQEPVDFLSGSHVENLGSVTLESGMLDLSSGLAVSAVNLSETSGAILTGSDPLTVSGPITWTGGSMSGAGSTVADGTLQLGVSGDTDDVEYLTVRTLEVSGGGTLEPLDTLEQSYGSAFVNTAADSLDVLAGVNWESADDDTATIDNQGALVVAAGISTATITGGGNFPFLTNPGGIGVVSGTLDLASDGTATGTLPASFTVAAGCTLQFDGDFTLGAGAGIGGPGIVEVDSGDLRVTASAFYGPAGTTTIDGGTIEIDGSAAIGTLNESNGDLTGPGTLTVTGTTVWTGGTMDGAGTTITQGGLQVGQAADANDDETLNGRTLTNSGTATWAGGGAFTQGDGGTFVNVASANFTIENDLSWYSDGTGTFSNAGTLVKSGGTGTTTLQAALDNTGSVHVQQGTLSLQGEGVVGGSYLVLAGATLTFGSDNVTTTSVALPSEFTDGPFNWAGTFAGSAHDSSGSGLASVGMSLFNGYDYYNGTAFTSPTVVDNAAVLSGNSWTYTIITNNFTNDLAYAAGSEAKDKDGGSESSTIGSLLLSPAQPTVSAVAPATGVIGGGARVTITGLALANATEVDFGATAATIVSDMPTTIVVISPLADATGSVNVTVTTTVGTSATSLVDNFTYFVVPTIAMTAPTNGTGTNNSTPTLAATAADGTGGSGLVTVQFEYSSNGGATWSDAGAAETSGPFNFTFATALANGTYLARATATDNAGHSVTASAVSFTIDAVIATPTPPLVIKAQLLEVTVVTGKGKHQKKTTKFAGFELIFNEALSSSSAQNAANYQVLQATKKGKKTVYKPVGLSLLYSPSDDTVSLTLAGTPTFTSGGKLVLTASGIADPAGDTLAGNTVFTIRAKAKGISG